MMDETICRKVSVPWRHMPRMAEYSDPVQVNSACLICDRIPISRGRSAREWFDDGYEAHLRGEEARAMRLYRYALEVDGAFVPARYNLGCLLTRQGNLADAEVRFSEVVETDPLHYKSHLMLGNIKVEQQQLLAAEEHLERCVDIAPDYADAYRSLAEVYDGLGCRRLAMQMRRRYQVLVGAVSSGLIQAAQ